MLTTGDRLFVVGGYSGDLQEMRLPGLEVAAGRNLEDPNM